MHAKVNPYPPRTGYPVSVTVSATDATTGSAISGADVLFDGVHVGTTGTPFIATIPVRRIFDPKTRTWETVPLPPSGIVTKVGYAPAWIDFGY